MDTKISVIGAGDLGEAWISVISEEPLGLNEVLSRLEAECGEVWEELRGYDRVPSAHYPKGRIAAQINLGPGGLVTEEEIAEEWWVLPKLPA